MRRTSPTSDEPSDNGTDYPYEEHVHFTFSFGTVHYFWRRLGEDAYQPIGIAFPNGEWLDLQSHTQSMEAAVTLAGTLLTEYCQRLGLPSS